MEDRLAELAELKRKKLKRKELMKNKRIITMQNRNLTRNECNEVNKQVTKMKRNNRLKSMIHFKPMTEKQMQNIAVRKIKSRKRKKMRKKHTRAKNIYNKPNPTPINNLLQNLRSSFKPLENVKVAMTTPQRLPTPRELSTKTGLTRLISELVSNRARKRETRTATRRAKTI